MVSGGFEADAQGSGVPRGLADGTAEQWRQPSAWAVAIYCRLVTVTFLLALAEPDFFPT